MLLTIRMNLTKVWSIYAQPCRTLQAYMSIVTFDTEQLHSILFHNRTPSNVSRSAYLLCVTTSKRLCLENRHPYIYIYL